MSLASADQTCGRNRSSQGLIPQLIIISQRHHVHRLQLPAGPSPPLPLPFFFLIKPQQSNIQSQLRPRRLSIIFKVSGILYKLNHFSLTFFFPWGLLNKSCYFFLQIVPAGASYLFWVGGTAKTYKKKKSIKLCKKSTQKHICFLLHFWPMKKAHLQSFYQMMN